jgi:hypothetical protein
MSRDEKFVDANTQKAKTPGKYIEVYEVHGCFPESWLKDDEQPYSEYDEDNYTNQIHIVSFLKDEESQKNGISLFKGKEKKGLFKVLKRDKRFGTALGRSAIEELIEPQVWTNYSMIQIKAMLDKASLMLGVTDDSTFLSKNKITDLQQGEWMLKQPGTNVDAFAFPVSNITAFENSIASWENHARMTGSASDPALGVDPVSGTPLGTTQLVTQQGLGIHEFRRGQIASFVEEIYREWTIPKMTAEMNKGQKFLSELNLAELEEVMESVVSNSIDRAVKERILSGNYVTKEQVETYKEFLRDDFMKGGNKKFLEIFKDEFAKDSLDVYVNVAGKQKNLNAMVDKLSNIFRSVFANPMILQDPNAAKIFNDIYEYSGFSPLSIKKVAPPVAPMPGAVESPIQNTGAVV